MEKIVKEADEVVAKKESAELKKDAANMFKTALGLCGVGMGLVKPEQRSGFIKDQASALNQVFVEKGLVTEGEKALQAVMMITILTSMRADSVDDLEAQFDKAFNEMVWGTVVKAA